MASITFNLFFAFLLILFIFEGGMAQQCRLSDISISQSKTGKVVEGQPEYEVVISNNCACPQSNLLVRCKGFSTVEPVDPTFFKLGDENCLISSGKAISQGQPISFHYAWLTPTDLSAAKSEIKCS